MAATMAESWAESHPLQAVLVVQMVPMLLLLLMFLPVVPFLWRLPEVYSNPSCLKYQSTFKGQKIESVTFCFCFSRPKSSILYRCSVPADSGRQRENRDRERPFANFLLLALRGRGEKKERRMCVDLTSCSTGKTERKKSPLSVVSVAESEAENQCEECLVGRESNLGPLSQLVITVLTALYR